MRRSLEVLGAVVRTVVVAAGVFLLVPAAVALGNLLGVVPIEPMSSSPADTPGAGILLLLLLLVLLPAGPLLVVLGLLIPGRGLPTVPPFRVRDGQRRLHAVGCVLVAVGPTLGMAAVAQFATPTGRAITAVMLLPVLVGVLIASQNVEPAGG